MSSGNNMEVSRPRFEFGANWRAYLKSLDEPRIRAAERSLREMLQMTDLKDQRFLDIGSGSGLFSLAARRLGALVYSFDFDAESVACAELLRQRYCAADDYWRIARGSVLDQSYLASLGTFDVVYSWGVLHHTGDLQRAMTHVAERVARGGLLFLAIYNDQGRASKIWTAVKRRYVSSGRLVRGIILGISALRLWGPTLIRDAASGNPLRTWRARTEQRGMDPWRDLVDWVGGYPFEVAKPEAVFHFYRKRGFTLLTLVTAGGGIGCNEFVFRRDK